MRQFGIAVMTGLFGMVVAMLVIWLIVGVLGATSFDSRMLYIPMALSPMGVGVGAILSRRLAGGVDVHPVNGARRIAFAVLGGAFTAVTFYVCYGLIAAFWSKQDFWALLLDPASLLRFRTGGVTENPPVIFFAGLGSFAGAWATDWLIKQT